MNASPANHAMQAKALPQASTGKARPVNGSRLGYKALVGKALLDQGHSLSQVQRMCKISRTAAIAIRRGGIVDPALAEAVRKTYANRMLLTGSDALDKLNQNLLNPPRASSLWKIAREAYETDQQAQGLKTQDIGDLLLQMGFKIAASISRLDMQLTKAPGGACLDVEANTEESST